MNELLAWRATLATLAVFVASAGVPTAAQRRRPERMARRAHATLREDGFIAVSQRKGSEVLVLERLLLASLFARRVRTAMAVRWGLRQLILLAPILLALTLACVLHPLAGPLAAVLVVVVLVRFERTAASAWPIVRSRGV